METIEVKRNMDLLLPPALHDVYIDKISHWYEANKGNLTVPNNQKELGSGARHSIFKDPHRNIVVCRELSFKDSDKGLEETFYLPEAWTKFRPDGTVFVDDILDGITPSAGIYIDYYATVDTAGHIQHHTDNDPKSTNDVERMINNNTHPDIDKAKLEEKYRNIIMDAKQVLQILNN